MASTIEDFQKYVSGSNEDITEFSPIIASYGDFTRVTGINAVLQLWKNILTTPKGTYPFDPNYGTDIHKLIFEQLDFTEMKKRIEEEIVNVLPRYEDRGEIEKIDIYLLTNKKGLRVNITCDFSGITKELSVNYGNQPIE